MKKFIIKLYDHKPYDQQIISILKQLEKPVPTSFLALLLQINHKNLIEKLQTLEKFGYIKKSTIVNASFYKIRM